MLPKPQPEPSPERRFAHVLVVEDDVLIRAVLADELRSEGFAVIEASCADDAMAYIRAGGPVDLVFSDVQMPGMLDGRQLAALVATDYPDIAVILTSGNTDLASQLQAVPFLRKPYRIAQAIGLVFSILNLTPPEGSL
jgi:CheY-like chemotaxis protein